MSASGIEKTDNAVVELSEKKDAFEIVGWYQMRSKSIEQKGKAKREGGQILIITEGDSAGLSDGTLNQNDPSLKANGSQASCSLISGVIEFHEFNTERDYGAIPKDALYREVSAHQAFTYLDQDSQAQLKEVFLASSPELSLGQNGNKGITLVFDKNLLKQELINRSREPLWLLTDGGTGLMELCTKKD